MSTDHKEIAEGILINHCDNFSINPINVLQFCCAQKKLQFANTILSFFQI